MDVESILGEEEVWSRQARVTVRTGHNFDPIVGSRSKFYMSFRRSYIHIVDVESILGEEEVWSRQARVTVLTCLTFDPIVGSKSKFYMSFGRPFSI